MTSSSLTDRPTTTLPDPDQRPLSDVVIYDGHCVFCRSQVERIARWDRRAQLSFLSLHDARVAERYPDLTFEQLMEQMYVIDRAGRRHAGAGALRYLSRKLPRLWILAPALHLPGTLPFWRWCYRQVAKRRYALAGKSNCDGDSCKIHFK